MRLHENKLLFRSLIEETAHSLNTNPFYIEKDYYVTMMLKNIALSDMRNYISFKGGTSLSKAYKIIKRFSEDVDLRVHQGNTSFGGGVAKRLYKSVEEAIPNDVLQSIGHINKGTSLREQRYDFANLFVNPTTETLSCVKLEQNYQSSFMPMEEKEIVSYIGDFILENLDESIVSKYSLEKFTLPTLSPKVTFAEKLGALEDYYYKGEHSNNFEKLISSVRHLYDLHMMVENTVFDDYLNSNEFDLNLKTKRENDTVKFAARTNKTHYNYLLHKQINECPLFVKKLSSHSFYSELKEQYNKSFSYIVFGELPDFSKIEASFEKISETIVENKTLYDFPADQTAEILKSNQPTQTQQQGL